MSLHTHITLLGTPPGMLIRTPIRTPGSTADSPKHQDRSDDGEFIYDGDMLHNALQPQSIFFKAVHKATAVMKKGEEALQRPWVQHVSRESVFFTTFSVSVRHTGLEAIYFSDDHHVPPEVPSRARPLYVDASFLPPKAPSWAYLFTFW
jgi:hypothetical protein